MNYRETLDYIHSVCWKGSRPGLSRITELLDAIGNPENGLKVVHVAGTNGKGSFCSMLTNVLIEAGYSVGSFTSPYIEEFTERIRYNGRDITKRELSSATGFIRPFADKMEDTPTEFELITAIGLEFFRRKKVDVVVLECGMGGRLDSTNVIADPLLSVITGIALDHTEYLGDTIEKIAGEKAGIIKPGCPVLFGGEDEGAKRVIAERASELGSVFYSTDRGAIRIQECTVNGSVFDYGRHKGVSLRLLGAYQPQNAANVIEAVKLLNTRGLAITDEALRRGLASAEWKGRFEPLLTDPPVFFDGGHNIEGATSAVETVKLYFKNKRVNVITGVMADKEYVEMAKIIASVANKAFTVAPDNPRALDAKEYAEVFRSLGVEAESFENYDGAVASALKNCAETKTPLLALGSLYAYAPFKKALRKALKLK